MNIVVSEFVPDYSYDYELASYTAIAGTPPADGVIPAGSILYLPIRPGINEDARYYKVKNAMV